MKEGGECLKRIENKKRTDRKRKRGRFQKEEVGRQRGGWRSWFKEEKWEQPKTNA